MNAKINIKEGMTFGQRGLTKATVVGMCGNVVFYEWRDFGNRRGKDWDTKEKLIELFDEGIYDLNP